MTREKLNGKYGTIYAPFDHIYSLIFCREKNKKYVNYRLDVGFDNFSINQINGMLNWHLGQSYPLAAYCIVTQYSMKIPGNNMVMDISEPPKEYGFWFENDDQGKTTISYEFFRATIDDKLIDYFHITNLKHMSRENMRNMIGMDERIKTDSDYNLIKKYNKEN